MADAACCLRRADPVRAGLAPRFERGVGMRENHPLVLVALVLPVPDRATLLLGLDGAPELSSALGVAALGLDRREHCEPVHQQLPITERKEDRKSVENPVFGILRATCLDGDLGEVEKPPALPPGEANVSGDLD